MPQIPTTSLVGASCPEHAGAAAVASCARCGVFVCAACRRHYDYQPLCRACYARRSHAAPASSRARWAAVLGVLGLTLIVLPFGIPAVVLAHAELTAIERGAAPAGGRGYARAGALMGWLANVVFFLALVVIVGLFAIIGAELP